MEVTFLKGHVPLVKTFNKEGVVPYPMVKKLDSRHYDVDLSAEGMRVKYETCVTMAKKGLCLLKGSLKQRLENESRSGKTNSKAPSHSFILDFDGIKLDQIWQPPFTGDTIRSIAQQLITLLPSSFHTASCIAHASASMGTKPGKVSMHLEFFLDTPLLPDVQKNLLRYMNLTNDTLSKNMALTATGRGLSWPLDVCTAENSRMIFIGTPVFDGVVNPIPNDDDRFQLMQSRSSDHALVNTAELMQWFDGQDLTKRQKQKLNELQELNGITDNTKDRMKKLNINNRHHYVVTNPPNLEMEVHGEFEHYITYNVGGGDSHAYYVLKNNPSVVYNWKGEPPFLFQNANEQAYAEHIENYGIVGEGPGVPIGFRDIRRDQHYSGMYDPASGTVHEINALSRSSMDDFFADNGSVTPDPIRQMRYMFDPQRPTAVDWAGRFINRFVEPPMMAAGTTRDPIHYDDILERVTLETPTIHKVLYSVCGCAENEMHRFLNWLAYIIQYRDKTKTTWLFQGVQGTGKGVLYSKVIKPILGQYAVEKRLPHIEEDFNDWQETCLLAAIDEFKVGRGARGQAFVQKMKNLITEDETTIRAMRSNQINVRSYMNFIMFTNEHDAYPIEASDRRTNVCPRQEVPIIERYPEIRDDIVKKIDGEVAVFSDLLHALEVNEAYAQTVMVNSAKTLMRETTMTALEEFAYALLNGNFEYFVELLDRQPGLGGGDETNLLIASQNTLRGWIKKAIDGEFTVYTTPAELRPIYMIMVGRIETDRKLSHALGHKGVTLDVVKIRGRVSRRIVVKLDPNEDWQWLADRYLSANGAPQFAQKKEANHDA